MNVSGTIGFFGPHDKSPTGIGYSQFQAVHAKLPLSSNYVSDGNDPHDPALVIGETAHLTLLVDPRGGLRARCAILPSKTLHLPRSHVAKALEQMNVTFRVGPILNEVSGLRMPLPVDVAGSWSWIARTGVELGQIEDISTISPATQQARLGDEPLHLREGYLKLRDAVGRQSK